MTAQILPPRRATSLDENTCWIGVGTMMTGGSDGIAVATSTMLAQIAQ